MPLYLSLHQAPGLSVEEIAGNAPEVAQQVHATFRQLYVNTDTGFIVSVYEADNAKALEEEFERIGFPFDAINEVDFTQNAAELAEMVQGGGGHV
ncbi:nickel-binding protein [Streptomyces sp. OE57]|uniref:nickel-binding protein n=1 Tax=Streptomyces lacaronensis TaxID=3379885 RepID=UPI0039B7599B